MYNVNGMPAVLIQNNRNTSSYYDDQDKQELKIKVCPYNSDMRVKFSEYTVQEAKGYFIVKSKTPVREGDQLIFAGQTFSILEVKDSWIWNKIANIIVAVK